MSYFKNSKTILLVFLIYFVNSEILSEELAGCSWKLKTDLPQNTSLYMKPERNEVIVPDGDALTLSINDKMIIACPGPNNYVLEPGVKNQGENRNSNQGTKTEVKVTCVGQNKLTYNSKEFTLKDFVCKRPLITDISLTKKQCGSNNTGIEMKLGYKISANGFVSFIEVCYDQKRETVLYTTNTIHKNAAIVTRNERYRPPFKGDGLSNKATPGFYFERNYTKQLEKLLGAHVSKTYLEKESLSRGHLSPDGDFLFTTWAKASYFLVNAAPQWQKINAGNWLRVENLARDIAKAYNNITSITGIFDVLQLTNATGRPTDIYLMDNRLLRVPKWYWKVVYSPVTKEGIAFVTSNNPFLTSIDASDFLCPNITASILSINEPEFENFKSGYTYCCEVAPLVKKLNITLPFTKNNIKLINIPYKLKKRTSSGDLSIGNSRRKLSNKHSFITKIFSKAHISK